jgi:hypothetical protein
VRPLRPGDRARRSLSGIWRRGCADLQDRQPLVL